MNTTLFALFAASVPSGLVPSSLASTGSVPGGTDPLAAATAPAKEAPASDAWSGFDAELERFVQDTDQGAPKRVEIHGLFKALWSHLPNSDVTGEDRAGVSLDRVQLGMSGELTDRAGYVLTLEGAGGGEVVLDAYGTWKACQFANVTFGQFRSPTVWESQLDDGELLFILRTDTGELFYTRDRGAMVSGSLEQLHWAAAVQNGLDSLEDRSSYSARVGLDVLGGGVGLRQGAYDTGRHTRLSVGAGYYDEQSQGDGKDGDVLVADAQFQWGRFAADAMFGKYQEFSNPFFVDRSDSKPFNVSASYMLVEELVETAVRYQDTDNVRQEKDFTFGINYYLAGHGLKLQLNASYIFSDLDSLDDTVRIGLGANLRI